MVLSFLLFIIFVDDKKTKKLVMTKIKEIVSYLDNFAPRVLSEDYDNVGLLIGDYNTNVSGVLITLDVTEEIIDEAIKLKKNVIVAHHPIIFRGIKKITNSNEIERIIYKAIKNDIAIYAGHTNFDNIKSGVNGKICEKLSLQNCKIISPRKNQLLKLITYVPVSHAEKLRQSIFDAGAGQIGNYSNTSFNSEGKGTFCANQEAKPFVGKKGNLHTENEIKIETIFPIYNKGKVITAVINNHPYEEPAYDIMMLENTNKEVGSGMIGNLKNALNETEFLALIKQTFNTGVIKHTKLKNNKIKKVAVCGGSCSFLINSAKSANADAFITADIKYHDFFDIENSMLLLDIGHYESEQYTKEIFYEILTKKFSNFAINLSEVDTNPIKYY